MLRNVSRVHIVYAVVGCLSLLFLLSRIPSSKVLPSMRAPQGHYSMNDKSRQSMYLMAPFVYPQLYRCPSEDVEKEWVSKAEVNEDTYLRDNIWSDYTPEERMSRIFVEIGAYDGLTGSVTYGFEHTWDWRGLLIEAHPDSSAKLVNNKGERPNSAIVTAAICGVDSDMTQPSQLHFTVGSGTVGTALEHAADSFLTQWNLAKDKSIAVDCLPIQAMFDAAGLQDIDLFSLDVEGAEYAVLLTIDFSVTNIHVVLVEASRYDPEKNEKVREFLSGNGFRMQAKNVGHSNEVWVNDRFEDIRSSRLSHPTVPSTLLGRVYYVPKTGKRCSTN